MWRDACYRLRLREKGGPIHCGGMYCACTCAALHRPAMTAHRAEVTVMLEMQRSLASRRCRGRQRCMAIAAPCRPTSRTEPFRHIVRFKVDRQYAVIALTSSVLASAAATCWQARLRYVRGICRQAVAASCVYGRAAPLAAIGAARCDCPGTCAQAAGHRSGEGLPSPS